MKKIISLLSIGVLFVPIFSPITTHALTPQTSSPLQLKELSEGTYEFTFADITASNAGIPIRSWKGTQIPKKIMLKGGGTISLDQDHLSSLLTKTRDEKTKISQLNKSLKSLTQDDLEVKLLPDRLQVIQRTQVKFTGKNFLDGEEDGGAPKDADTGQEAKLLLQLQKDCQANLSELPSALKGNCTQKSLKQRLETIEKTLSTEEMVEISLIPPSFDSASGSRLLNADPTQARFSKNEILSRFEAYRAIKESQNFYSIQYQGKTFRLDEKKYKQYQNVFSKQYGVGSGTINSATGTLIGDSASYTQEVPYIFQNDALCDRYADASEKQACKDLFAQKQNATSMKYEQLLLNGFTLGQADSFTWKKSLYAFDYKIFKGWLTVGYSYGFGVRIPMKITGEVEKNILDDFETSSGNHAHYQSRISLDTVDLDAKGYLDVGLPSKKVFEGNELVLELDAYLDAGIYLRGVVDKKYHFSLVDTVIRAILTQNGFSQEEINQIVTPQKGFNMSKGFKPPFAGEDEIELLKLSGGIPVVEAGSFKVIASADLIGYLDGRVEASCINKNSFGGCPTTVVFDTHDQKVFSSTGVFNEADYRMDALGAYSTFGPILGDFSYIPELSFDILVYGKVKARMPIIDERYSYSTPKWEVYTFEMDLPSLGSHEGTKGTFDLTTSNRIYTATKNPTPLKENYQHLIGGVETVYEDGNDIPTIINDSLIDLSARGNARGLNYTVFTTDGSAPDCQRSPKLTLWEPIWKNAKNELVPEKSITLKSRGCDLFGNETPIKTSTYMVRNTYYEPSFLTFETFQKTLQGLQVSTPLGETGSYLYYTQTATSKLKSVGLVGKPLPNSYFTYTLDGSTPSCLATGSSKKYTKSIAREELEAFMQDPEATDTTAIKGKTTLIAINCLPLSAGKFIATKPTRLKISFLSSQFEAGLQGLENTDSQLLDGGILGEDFAPGMLEGLGDNIGGNAGGPSIQTFIIDHSQHSDDAYIQSKLKEIDESFSSLYTSHLENIDAVIAELEVEKEQVEAFKKASYELAIQKLKELRELYITKYQGIE